MYKVISIHIQYKISVETEHAFLEKHNFYCKHILRQFTDLGNTALVAGFFGAWNQSTERRVSSDQQLVKATELQQHSAFKVDALDTRLVLLCH